jgi:hypothetical protein
MKVQQKPGRERAVPEVTVETLRAKLPGLAKRAETSPLAAIKLHCLDCGDGTRAEVEICPNPSCPLYPFRHGKRPGGRKMTDEQRQAASDRAKARWGKHEEDAEIEEDVPEDEGEGESDLPDEGTDE